jgi:hypothetical protein
MGGGPTGAAEPRRARAEQERRAAVGGGAREGRRRALRVRAARTTPQSLPLTRTARSEAIIVRGAAYDVGHLSWRPQQRDGTWALFLCGGCVESRAMHALCG